MTQTTMSFCWKPKGTTTRRGHFLTEMHAMIPWKLLPERIEPHYSKAGSGTQPMPLARMLPLTSCSTIGDA